MFFYIKRTSFICVRNFNILLTNMVADSDFDFPLRKAIYYRYLILNYFVIICIITILDTVNYIQLVVTRFSLRITASHR